MADNGKILRGFQPQGLPPPDVSTYSSVYVLIEGSGLFTGANLVLGSIDVRKFRLFSPACW